VETSTASDPTSDSKFTQAHHDLQNALAKVAARTKPAFGDGWGMLVMFRLAESASAVSLDLAWDSKSHHYESGKIAVAGTGD